MCGKDIAAKGQPTESYREKERHLLHSPFISDIFYPILVVVVVCAVMLLHFSFCVYSINLLSDTFCHLLL